MGRERIIYHIDVNSAYLSWTAAYRIENGIDTVDLRDISSVIGGSEEDRQGIVLAKSVQAKKYKIETGEPLASARKKCPGLVVVPPDYPLYVQCSKSLLELLRGYSDRIEQYSIDEVYMDMSGFEPIHGFPVIFADYLRETIQRQLGFTVNIGVSSNKLLAKMAGELKKPNRVQTLFPWEVKSKLWPLEVKDLFYVGRATAGKLSHMGIRTVGELADTPPEVLKTVFKPAHGQLLYDFANGIDRSELLDLTPTNKGYGNSKTLKTDITGYNRGKIELLSLCETVGARIRADGVKIGVVGISVRDYEFHQWGHQRTLKSETDLTCDIFETAFQLLREAWDGRIPIRQIGIHTGRAKKSSYYQYNLFDGYRKERLLKLERAVDSIRNRYGEDSIFRASFLGSEICHMSGGIDKAKRGGLTKPV